MPTIFVHEFVTGGGWWTHAAEPMPKSLLQEGAAMRDALLADLAALPDMELICTRDSRAASLPFDVRECLIGDAPAERRQIMFHAAKADATFLIAPELDRILVERIEWIDAASGNRIGPSLATASLCANKHLLCEHLRRNGVRTPAGIEFTDQLPNSSNLRWPRIIKPVDGAGSQRTRCVANDAELAEFQQVYPSGGWRVEEFQPGMPASVGFLCGSSGRFPLPPSRQNIASDREFTYLGGTVPLPATLAERATKLACTAVATLPDTLGYLGVDLVLGDDRSGADDVVLEINPRITTSYVGLRALAKFNLTGAMLAIAQGAAVELDFHPGPVEFTAGGQILFS